MKELQAGIQQVQAKCIPLHQYPAFPEQESKPVTRKALRQKDSNQQFNRRPPLKRRSPINKQVSGIPPLNHRPKLATKATPLSKPSKPRKRINRQKLLAPATTKPSLQQLQQRTNNALRRLGNQAERINQISAELEAAIWELQAIASEVNQNWKALQVMQQSTTKAITPEICEYQATSVPTIEQKPCGSLVLTSRLVQCSRNT
ncbi:MAG: hypothetical protein F6K41_00960 [Symploca sp. SIO3E6]|nr:hypothetical protein [Caldora sp. SIO3E6]